MQTYIKKVCENKETDSPSGIYRMKLLGTCSLLKESHEKKKLGLLFFGEWDYPFSNIVYLGNLST